MHDIDMLEDRVVEELNKIAEKGMTTNNLEIAGKLIDIYKDIKEAEHYCREMDGGYSGARNMRTGRYMTSRDGYEDKMSRDYDRYMDNKASYRYSGAGDCKQRMMKTLEDYMDSFTDKMENMLRDADCQEERDTINRYLSKIRTLK